jgi:hypothetical protein
MSKTNVDRGSLQYQQTNAVRYNCTVLYTTRKLVNALEEFLRLS